MKRKTTLTSMLAGMLALGTWAAVPAYAHGSMTLYSGPFFTGGAATVNPIVDTGCQALSSDIMSAENDSTHTIYFYSSGDCSGIPACVTTSTLDCPVGDLRSYEVM